MLPLIGGRVTIETPDLIRVEYENWPAQQLLLENTHRSHLQVHQDETFLGARSAQDGDSACHPSVCNNTACDYKTILKTESKAKPRSVNFVLAATDSFYLLSALDRTKREDLLHQPPETLKVEEQTTFLSTVERHSSIRDRSKMQICDNHDRIALQSTQKITPIYAIYHLNGYLRQYKSYYLLDQIIFKCYLEYKGGEAFFEKLDSGVRDKNITNLLLKQELLIYEDIIVSGKFGIFFYSTYRSLFKNIIVVDGGLREAGKELRLDISSDFIRRRNFAFVDDSFYSGITREKITSEIRRLGGDIKQCFVIYDGSKVKDNSVTSLYRYYD